MSVDKAAKSALIGKVMQIGIDTVNNELDISNIFKLEAQGEDRTVEFSIYEDAGANQELTSLLYQQGYHVINGRIESVTLQNYTVRYKLGESTWMSLITQRRTFRQLQWYGEMEAEGDYTLRDFIIWSRFFEIYGEKVKIPFLAKAMLKPAPGVV
jgi:hypothetical protein